jgi:hypothetical protein
MGVWADGVIERGGRSYNKGGSHMHVLARELLGKMLA